MPTP
jgi:hypothetical protein